MAPSDVGRAVEELDTPVLLTDLSVAEANIVGGTTARLFGLAGAS
jgi:hypothetical protein